MNHFLEVVELPKEITPSSQQVKKALKITNTSSKFINNLKLYIEENDLQIIEQSIIRRRGALSFEITEHALELGNLAPSESAYFEYKLSASLIDEPLLPISFSFVPEDSNHLVKRNLGELLSTDSFLVSD